MCSKCDAKIELGYDRFLFEQKKLADKYSNNEEVKQFVTDAFLAGFDANAIDLDKAPIMQTIPVVVVSMDDLLSGNLEKIDEAISQSLAQQQSKTETKH